MENTLRLIVDADKASRLDVEKAKERRENLTDELGIRKQEIDQKHKEDAAKAIAKVRSNADIKVKRSADEIEKNAQMKIDGLKKIYDENHKDWVKDIVNAVTKG